MEVERLFEIERKLISSAFYGKIEVSFIRGVIVNVKKTENVK